MRKRMYFIGMMAQIGVYATVAMMLWWLTELDVLKVLCISAMASVIVSLPILMQIEGWINEND